MTVKKLNVFMESVLTLHQSARQRSQRMLPKVLLKRLSSHTIQKYTEKHERFHSTDDQPCTPTVSPSRKVPLEENTPNFICKSPRRDENILGTQIENDKRNDVLSVHSSVSTFTSSKLASIESQEKISESEKRLSEVSESDETDSSCNSDNLPDLNDPSWGKEVTQPVRRRRKKKKGILKTHPKLMKNARKAFEHKAFMYKISKEFMRNSKATKEIENVEVHSYHTDKVDYQCISKVSDNNPSNTMPQSFLSRPVTASPSGKNFVFEISEKSKAEIISSKVKESLARYAEHEKSNFLSKDAIGIRLESSNALDAIPNKEKANQQGRTSEVILDSDESDSTVIFEDPHMQDICHIESVHSLSMEPNVDDHDLTTVAENTNKQKRKDSSLGINNSDGGNKKLRKDQHIMHIQNEVNEHPMVMIPLSAADQQYCSNKRSCSAPNISQAHKPQQNQCGPVVSTIASQTDDTTCMGNKENPSTPIQERKSSELYFLLSKTSTADFTQNSLRKQVTGKKSASASQGESTGLDDGISYESEVAAAEDSPVILYSSTSCEVGKKSDKDVHVTGKARGEVNQNQMPSRLSLVAKVDDQEQKKHDMKKVAGSCVEKPFKSLKQMSLQFKELTTKRTELEDEIRQVKEEYNKKLEALEEQKKAFDLDIKKLIDAMSAWKELSEGDQLSPSDQQQEGADVNSTVSIAQPTSLVSAVSVDTTSPTKTSLSTTVTAVTEASSASSSAVMNSLPEKVAINVIPAANIRNFGTKEGTSPLKEAALPADPPPRMSGIHTRKARMVPQAPATVSSSQSGSRDFSPTSALQAGLQPRSAVSAMNQPVPPNVVVVPGQLHPVSSHMVCRMTPCPPTNQRHQPMGQTEGPARLSSPGSLHGGNKSQGETLQSLPSHLQQNSLHTSVQLQKQQQHQMQQLQQQQHYQKQQQQQQHHQQQQQQHQHQQPQQLRQNQPQQQMQQQQQQQPHLQQQQQLLQGIVVIQPQQQQHMQERQQLLKQTMQHQHKQLKQNQQQQQQQQQPLNQQKVSFQPSSNTQFAQQHHKSQPYVHHYQQGRGQFPSNSTLLKGATPGAYNTPVNSSNSDSWTNAQVVPNIPMTTHTSTSPSNRIIVTYSQSTNSPTSTEKTPCIVSVPSMTVSTNPINYVHVQPFTSDAGDSIIGLPLPPVSNLSAPGNTDRLVSVQATQAPSSNRSVSQPTGVILPAPAASALDPEEAAEPICRMCGLTGIFTCCSDIIYCSTVCQRKDWINHQQKCTNTSTPDGS